MSYVAVLCWHQLLCTAHVLSAEVQVGAQIDVRARHATRGSVHGGSHIAVAQVSEGGAHSLGRAADPQWPGGCVPGSKSAVQHVHIALQPIAHTGSGDDGASTSGTAFGAGSLGVVVTWSTWSTCATTAGSVVQYSRTDGTGTNTSVTGTSTRYQLVDKANPYTSTIHRVLLTGLTSGAQYTYRAGCPEAWGRMHTFFAPPPAGQKSLHFLALADMSSAENDGGFGGVIHEIEAETKRNNAAIHNHADQGGANDAFHYDVLLHAGDLAYDLHADKGAIGDAFMDDIEPIAATIPYHVAPGNHESYSNFSHFINRFTMPQREQYGNLWWSMDVGPVHFLSYNTEAYFDGPINSTVQRQYEWMRADLEQAQQRRAQVPWIIVQGHRPFYCNVGAKTSVTGAFKCDGEQEQSRVGPASQHGRYAVEPLFHEFGVDLALYGHVHDYSRFLPVYNHTPHPGSRGAPYTNPKATVHLTIGGAGNPEMPQPPHSKCSAWDNNCTNIQSWSPWAECESGYFPKCPNFNFGRVSVANATHLHWQQVSVTKAGKARGGVVVQNASVVPGYLMDDFWLVQQHHGPFGAP